MNITVYDSTGDRRVQVAVKEGDVLHWKKSHTVGVTRCTVLEVREAAGTLKVGPHHCGGHTVVKGSSRTFLALYRDGRRLP